MKFSIILPCFNSKSYINKCVDSILSQSFSDYELIVIDDGSTDGTSQILDTNTHRPILTFMSTILAMLVFLSLGSVASPLLLVSTLSL